MHPPGTQSQPIPAERWLPVPGFEGRYEVSDLGRVRAIFRVERQKQPPRYIGDRIKPTGRMPYWQVTLVAADGSRRHALIHQLVLEAFVGPCPEGMECRHLDGDSDRNALANLRWGTRRENLDDRAAHGTAAKGEQHGSAKLSESDVREIRRLGTSGLSQRAIGIRFGVAQATVGRILRGIAWSHIS